MRYILFLFCCFLSLGSLHAKNYSKKPSHWQWLCMLCDKQFYTSKTFLKHLQKKHKHTYFVYYENNFDYDERNIEKKGIPPEDMEEKIIGTPVWVRNADPYARWWCTAHRCTFRDYDRFKEHLRFYHRNT